MQYAAREEINVNNVYLLAAIVYCVNAVTPFHFRLNYLTTDYIVLFQNTYTSSHTIATEDFVYL